MIRLTDAKAAVESLRALLKGKTLQQALQENPVAYTNALGVGAGLLDRFIGTMAADKALYAASVSQPSHITNSYDEANNFLVRPIMRCPPSGPAAAHLLRADLRQYGQAESSTLPGKHAFVTRTVQATVEFDVQYSRINELHTGSFSAAKNVLDGLWARCPYGQTWLRDRLAPFVASGACNGYDVTIASLFHIVDGPEEQVGSQSYVNYFGGLVRHIVTVKANAASPGTLSLGGVTYSPMPLINSGAGYVRNVV